jgi:TP901 family phage tail tape measure protein
MGEQSETQRLIIEVQGLIDAKRYEEALLRVDQASQNIIQTSRAYNSANQTVTQGLVAQVGANERLALTTKAVDGEIKSATVSLKRAGETAAEAARRQKELDEATSRFNRTVQASQSVEILTQRFRTLRDQFAASPQNIGAASQALAQLRAVIERIGADPGQVANLFTRIQTGATGTLTTLESQLFPTLNRLSRIFTNVRTEGEKANQALIAQENAARRLQAVTEGLTGVNILARRFEVLRNALGQTGPVSNQAIAAFTQLRNAVERTGVSGQPLIRLFERLQNGEINVKDAAERQLVPALNSVLRVFRSVQQEGNKTRQATDEARNAFSRLANTASGLVAVDRLAAQFQVFAAQANLTPAAIANANAALNKLRKVVQDTALTGPQITKLFQDIRNGTLNVQTAAERLAAGPLKTLAGQFKDTGEEGKKAASELTLSWTTFARAVMVSQVLRAVNTVRQALTEAITTAADFQVKVTEIRTLSQEAQLSSSQWAESLREVSDAFGIDILNVAEAAYQALSNQVAKGAEVQTFLTQAAQFAQAAVTDLTTATNLLTGALNSFQLGVEETNRVSAALFKTIELGRIRANDMANTFGRTGVLARQLGVEIEELGALFSSSTRNGIRFNESQTLVRQLFLKLIKPTEAFKDLLLEWGVASGEAAIQTFGLEGVVKRLGDELETGGISRIAELFGRVRAISAVALISREGARQFSSDLKKFEEDSDSFIKAINLRFESAGAILQREINAIKNALIVDFGQDVVNAVQAVTQIFGGLRGTLLTIKRTLEVAALSFVAFKIAVNAGAVVTAIQSIITALTAMQGSLLATNLVFNATFVGAVVAGVTAIVAAFVLFNESTEESLERFREEATLGMREAEVIVLKFIDNTTAAIRKSIRLRTQEFLQFVATVRKEFTELQRIQGLALEALNDRLKVSIDATVDSARDAIKELETIARSAERRVEQASRRQREIPIEFEEAEFAREFSSADIEKQISLLDVKIRESTARLSEALGKELTEVNVQEQIRLFDDIKKRTEELIKIQDRLNKEAAKGQEDLAKLVEKRREIESKGEERRLRAEASVAKIVGNTNAQIQRRAEAERRIGVIEAQTRADLEKNERAQQAIKDRLEEITKLNVNREVQLNRLRNIRNLEIQQNNKVLEQQKAIAAQAKSDLEVRRERFVELQTALKQLSDIDVESIRRALGPRATSQQLQAEVNRQVKAVQETIGRTGLQDDQAIINVIQLLNAKRLELNKQFTTAAALQELESAQQLATAERKLFEEKLENEKAIAAARGKNALARQAALEAEIKTVQTLQRIQGIPGVPTRIDPQVIAERARAAAAAQDLPTVTKEIAAAEAEITRLQEVLDKLDPLGFSDSTAKALLKVERAFLNLLLQAREAIVAEQRFEQSLDALEGTEAQLKQMTDQLEALTEQQREMDNLTASVNRFNAAINRLGRAVNVIRRFQGREGVVPQFRDPDRMAQGGVVGGSGNGDTVPALLTPGEFVVNKKAAQRFMPQLMALNRRRFADGGAVGSTSSVTVNVGGIHTQPGQHISEEAVARAVTRAIHKRKLKIR